MQRPSDDFRDLRSAIGRIAAALFTFALLTGVPLLGDLRPGSLRGIEVAQAAHASAAPDQEETRCQI
jgi:hypothetical protein